MNEPVEFLNPQCDAKIAARWLPWARLKIQQMTELGLTSKMVSPEPGVLIKLLIHDDLAHIAIWSGASGDYQFIGSGPWLYKTYRDPDYAPGYDRNLPLGYAVLVTLRYGQFKATPLFSSAEESNESKWPYDADPRDTNNHLMLTPAHQTDGLGVQQWYGPTADSPRKNLPNLITTWQQAHPCEGLGWYGSGSAAQFVTLDMNYDYGPQLFTSSNPFVGTAKIPDSDWYGAAAYTIIEGRPFIIMVDVNSVFYCYPTEGYDGTILFSGWLGEAGNVPASLTKSHTCPWPAWVSAESLGVEAIDLSVPDAVHRHRLRPAWKFNHAGTRAVCVTAHRETNWADGYFNSTSYDDSGTLVMTYQEDYPGMVEVEFSITITGTALSDFSFDVTLRQSIYSKTDHRTPVAAGYAVKAMGDVTLDTLLLLEYRHYIDNPAQTTGPDNNHGGVETYSLKRPNKATVAVVSRQTDSGWTTVLQWLAYYACYAQLGDGFPFYPHINEFSALSDKSGFANHFRFLTNIVSLDLDSLSFCIYATVRTIGDIQTGSSTWQTYGAEGGVVATIAFGSERDRRSVGHLELTPVISSMLDLEADYPNIATMTEFDLGATLDYAHYDASAWESDAKILATKYATLSVTDGYGNSWSSLVEDASEDLTLYSNMAACPLFSGYSHIYGPQVFTYWDGFPNIRPGIRWAVGGTLQAGTLSFSGYPYGAIHHNSVLFLTTAALNNVYARFSTHRNGSFALFAGPFAARTDLQPWWQNGVPLTAPALAYEQTVVDLIYMVSDDVATGQTTTHVAMLNQAFSKSWTPEEYYFTLQYESSVGAEFKPAASNPSAPSWYPVSKLAPLSVIGAHQWFSLDRWYNEFCLSASFVTQSLYGSDNSFACFPTPRMEGVFLPP